MTSSTDKLVILDYNDLLKDPKQMAATFHPLFNKAFGNLGNTATITHEQPLGLIAIKNVPNFIPLKQKFLPMGYKLATLPPTYLNSTKLTDSQSMYNAGWSYGKEMLSKDKPDLAKGSFYFNPITDKPGTDEDRKMYPASYPCNLWPDEDMIPEFRDTAKKMGCLMKDVVVFLVKHLDVFVNDNDGNNCHDLERLNMGEEMGNTEKVKGRLLYYFPLDDSDNPNVVQKEDSWIGWHNDSGFLTALAGDMYMNHKTGQIVPKDKIDPNAGLHVMNREGQVVKVDIPEECMSIQIGECMQIVTGGKVVATPHCVKGVGGSYKDIARVSFPAFIDTVPSYKLKIPSGKTRNDVLDSGIEGCAKVPPLEERWQNDGMEFGSFLQKTFEMYYNWSL